MAKVNLFITLAEETDGDHVLARMVDQGFTIAPLHANGTLYTRTPGSPIVLAMMQMERGGDREAMQRAMPAVTSRAFSGLSVLTAVVQIVWGGQNDIFLSYAPSGPVTLDAKAPKGKAKKESDDVYGKLLGGD